jgi:dipeptidyl aminopeptidase/acylaminoacyl peptidase
MRTHTPIPALLAVLAACAAPARQDVPAAPAELERELVARITAPGTPSLEEIFLLPSAEGEAPRVESLSADGTSALVRWAPLARDERGRRARSDASDLWLVALDPAARSAGAPLSGVRLDLLLPPPTVAAADARRPAASWSERGARLALVRGGELFVLEPQSEGWSVRLLHADSPAAPLEEERARPTRLGSSARATWVDGDRALRLALGREVLRLELARAAEGLAGASWTSAAVHEHAAGAQWSDGDGSVFRADRPVAFLPPPLPEPAPQVEPESASEPPAAENADLELAAAGELGVPQEPRPPVQEPGPESAPERGAPAQVLHMAEGRAVALEGFDALAGRESERLSPDGRWVFAFARAEDPEPEPNLVPDFLSERVSTRDARRERADDVERGRAVWIWDAHAGARTQLEWDGWEGASISSLGWAPQPQAQDGTRPPARLALVRTSAERARRELWCFEQGTWRRLLEERDPHWLGGPAGPPRWSVDGSRLLVPAEWLAGSSTPGRCQLFELDPSGGALRQLTAFEGELDAFAEAPDGRIAATGSRADPARRVLLAIERDGASRELALPPGWLDAPRAAGGSVVVQRATLGQPAELWWAAADGSRSGALSATVPEEFAAAPRLLPQRLRVHGALGADVWSHVWLPRGVALDGADRPRACVVFVHGAGYLQNVSDSLGEYPVNFLFHERLARMGYVVLDVDYRGSKGYGALFRGEVQYHLGGHDLDDIARSVDELAARGLVDPARVGLYGGSYGGFLTLMALFTQPQRWACGAALRSVTDWRSYHPDYTVPRLGRPSTHPESYQRSSPIDHAARLERPLLLLHGMVDSNVFAQDTIRLMETLIDLGKPFEAMLYPSQGHAFEDGMHWLDEYGRIEAFLVGHLGPP